MTILAIDTTGEKLTVAVDNDGQMQTATSASRPHSKALLPLIAKLLGPRRPQAIAVAVGPGSYTGTRIGVVTANTLGWAWDIPVIGIGGNETQSIKEMVQLARQRLAQGKLSRHAFPKYEKMTDGSPLTK